MQGVVPRIRPSLEIIGDSEVERSILFTLFLDFDVRYRGQIGAAPDVFLVLATRDTFRRKLDEVRSRADTPAMVVLGDCDAADRVLAFEAGADDIVSSGIDPAELMARLRALLRRRSLRPAGEIFRVEDLEIDVLHRTVRRNGRIVDLTRLELDALLSLARRNGAVVRHTTLIREVWGAHKTMGTVHTLVSYLRAKIERDGELPVVHTVRGVGYALRSNAS